MASNLPRFVNLDLTFDSRKIVCPDEFLKDKLWMKNVFSGQIIQSEVYPLIFEVYDEKTIDQIKYRTLQFYQEIVKESQKHQESQRYQEIDKENKVIFHIGIRDLFIASGLGLLNQEENNLLKEIIRLVKDESLTIDINGVSVSPHPTRENILVQYINSEHFPEEIKPYYIIIRGLCMAFVNPKDLSYHNFENIIPMNDYFSNQDINLRIGNVTKHPTHDIYTFDIKGLDLLLGLDGLNLYVSPMNSNSRGGKRFIFSSHLLSQLLTNAILDHKNEKDVDNKNKNEDSESEDSEIDEREIERKIDNEDEGPLFFMPTFHSDITLLKRDTNSEDKNNKRNKSSTLDPLRKNLKFVNHVFRYNKFEPGDKKFISHYDTPYYDSKNKQCSLYTMIIYLTEGKSNSERPSLSIDGQNFKDIKKMSCIIFNQKYEHEGNPFIDNDKIFVRTELIYSSLFDLDEKLCKVFNMACYMNKQSIYNQELKDYSNYLFNYSAKARFSVTETFKNIKYLHKVYKGIHFVTDGNDYWFLSGTIGLKEISVLILLDYFNGYLKDKVNKVTETTIISEWNSQQTDNEIYAYLIIKQYRSYIKFLEEVEFQDNKDKTVSILSEYKVDLLQPLELVDKHCCDYHKDNFDPDKCSDVIEVYNDYIKQLNENKSSISILDDKIKINIDDIQITDDKIIFKTTGHASRINFASCWNSENSPRDYVEITKKDLSVFHVPEIPYRRDKFGYKLSIDMFNNGFILREDSKAKIPKIIDSPEKHPNESDSDEEKEQLSEEE